MTRPSTFTAAWPRPTRTPTYPKSPRRSTTWGIYTATVYDVAAAQAALTRPSTFTPPPGRGQPRHPPPDLAMTLNNLGNLYRDRHDVAAAQAACDGPPFTAAWPTPTQTPTPARSPRRSTTWGIYTATATTLPPPRPPYDAGLPHLPPPGRGQPGHLPPKVAMTLNNLVVLYRDRHDVAAAPGRLTRSPHSAAWPTPTQTPTCPISP